MLVGACNQKNALLRDCKTSRNLRKPSFEALVSRESCPSTVIRYPVMGPAQSTVLPLPTAALPPHILCPNPLSLHLHVYIISSLDIYSLLDTVDNFVDIIES